MEGEFFKFMESSMKKFMQENASENNQKTKENSAKNSQGQWGKIREEIEKATKNEKSVNNDKAKSGGKNHSGAKNNKQPKIQKKIEKTRAESVTAKTKTKSFKQQKAIKKQSSDTKTERFCSAITKTTGEECGAKIKDPKEEYCGKHTNYGWEDSSEDELVEIEIEDEKICSHFFENGNDCTYRATQGNFCGKHYNFAAYCGLYQCGRKLKEFENMFCSECRAKIKSRKIF